MNYRNFGKHPKSKFNKRRCAKCKYHGGSTVNSLQSYIICNYAAINQSCCLQRQDDGSIVDIRGDDYDGCRCFEKGAAIGRNEFRAARGMFIEGGNHDS